MQATHSKMLRQWQQSTGKLRNAKRKHLVEYPESLTLSEVKMGKCSPLCKRKIIVCEHCLSLHLQMHI